MKLLILSIFIIIIFQPTLVMAFDINSVGQLFSGPWNELLSILYKIWSIAVNFWNSYIWPKIEPYVGNIWKQKEEDAKQGFEREKKEMKEDAPKTVESLWEKFKEIIK